MKLGKLFIAVVKTATLPVSIAADAITMGVAKVTDGEFITEKSIKSIANDLDDVTN